MAHKHEKETEQTEARFPVADLVAHADLFDTTPELLAGALHGKADATKAEATDALEKFKQKEVE